MAMTVVEFAEKVATEYAGKAAAATGKVLRGTGKAAWILGTTFIVLVVPLVICLGREQMHIEYESAFHSEQRILGF